jgi:serine/threonine protein kinase
MFVLVSLFLSTVATVLSKHTPLSRADCCSARRPPFEVEDEAQTAALIMYSDAIKFPPNRTPQWCDFVKSTLVKNPDVRPTATALLKHPW